MAASDYDNLLLSPDWYAKGEYADAFRDLRDNDPVHWTHDEAFGREYWTVTRYDDVRAALENHTQLSNRWQSRVPLKPRRHTPEERYEMGFDVSIPFLDEPLHSLYRRPLNKHFSVPSVGRLAKKIDELVDEVIANVAERGECDIAEDVAKELPMRVVFSLLGVPEEEWGNLVDAAGRMGAPSDPRWNIGDSLETFKLGMSQVAEYGLTLARQRRADPQDDLVTAITRAEIDGDPLSDREVQWWIVNIIRAATETTGSAATYGLWLLLNHKDQAHRLVDDPSLSASAVEECLRMTTPSRNRLRVANEHLTIGDKEISPGDWVVLFLYSANHDERAFDDPYRFDIGRTPNEHLSFSAGIHGCLGRNLARLELRILFPKFLAAFPDVHVRPGFTPQYVRDTSSTGLRSLPVEFTPTRRGAA